MHPTAAHRRLDDLRNLLADPEPTPDDLRRIGRRAAIVGVLLAGEDVADLMAAALVARMTALSLHGLADLADAADAEARRRAGGRGVSKCHL